MLRIDYFNDGSTPKVDKSDFIASLTCINPILNGDLAPYLLGVNIDKDKYIPAQEGGTFKDRWFVGVCKTFTVIQNLLSQNQTMNVKREVIKRVFTSSKAEKDEVLYELGMQPYILFDFNSEVHGFNKRKSETIL